MLEAWENDLIAIGFGRQKLLVICDLFNYVSEHCFILVKSIGQCRAAHDASQTWQEHFAVPLLHNLSFSQNIKYLKSCRGA